MSTSKDFLTRILLFICLSACWVIVAAQENGPTETTGSTHPSSTSSGYNVFSAIASSASRNGATGSTDEPRTVHDSNEEGASGDDNGGITLSTGAIIAIAVVGGAAVVIGIASAVLFYLAKKREWKVRERMRRSARKVAAALTPKSATFKRSELPFNTSDTKDEKKTSRNKASKKGMVRIDPPSYSSPFSANKQGNRGRNSTTPPASNSSTPSNRSRESSREADAEKGFGTHTRIEAIKKSERSQPSPGTPPKSTFDMDSPVEEKGKNWSKLFSRR